MADEPLAALNGRFEALYSSMGRPSIPPEMLLRAFVKVRGCAKAEAFAVAAYNLIRIPKLLAQAST